MNLLDRIAWRERYRWLLILHLHILCFTACYRCILPFDISDAFDSALLAQGILGGSGMPLSHIQRIRIGNSAEAAVHIEDMLIYRGLTYAAFKKKEREREQPRSRYNNGFIIKGNTSCASTAPIVRGTEREVSTSLYAVHRYAYTRMHIPYVDMHTWRYRP